MDLFNSASIKADLERRLAARKRIIIQPQLNRAFKMNENKRRVFWIELPERSSKKVENER